jgi:Domain of unknown function (DUF4159)
MTLARQQRSHPANSTVRCEKIRPAQDAAATVVRAGAIEGDLATMARSKRLAWIFGGLCLLAGLIAGAQGYRRIFPPHEPPPTGFIAARWRFGTNGWFGHMGWSHNYPASDRNLNAFIARATNIDVEHLSYRIVELGSSEVFDYPFAYVSEPGEMQLTEAEVTHLRQFVERGGFVLMDDFDGPRQLENMMAQVRRAFPDRDFVPLTLEHRVFHMHFDLHDLEGMAPYVPGGFITYFGLFDADGELAILAGYNNDLANFWEWYDQPHMPLEPAADAFRLGTNAVVYAMTH